MYKKEEITRCSYQKTEMNNLAKLLGQQTNKLKKNGKISNTEYNLQMSYRCMKNYKKCIKKKRLKIWPKIKLQKNKYLKYLYFNRVFSK